MLAAFRKDRIIAPPGYNRWRVPVAFQFADEPGAQSLAAIEYGRDDYLIEYMISKKHWICFKCFFFWACGPSNRPF